MAKSKKKNRPDSKLIKVIRIVKNTIFVSVLAILVLITIVTLTARINGETPKLFGNALYRVSSGSMSPYLEVGDIILSAECDPMELEDGDVITYNGKSGQFAGKRITHRVVKAPYYNEERGEYYLVTKGDDNPIEDTPIEISQVTGKMVFKIEILKQLFNFFITPWGLLTLIALIILAFFNEIVLFAKTLLGMGEQEESEDIQDIIERIQLEEYEKKKAGQEQAAQDDPEEDNAEKDIK